MVLQVVIDIFFKLRAGLCALNEELQSCICEMWFETVLFVFAFARTRLPEIGGATLYFLRFTYLRRTA